MSREPVVVPARKAKAFRIPGSASVRIVNTHGTQVVDTWAFASGDPAEFMSMEHSRLHMGRLSPIVGDRLVTNRRRPILMLAEDTSGGVHDTLLAACDEHRYALLGCVGRHDNCTDNLHAALRELDIRISHTPAPLNLFENAWPDRRGVIAIQPPVCGPGGYVTLQAQIELVLVLSACPQDMAPTNGAAMRPQDVHVQLLGA